MSYDTVSVESDPLISRAPEIRRVLDGLSIAPGRLSPSDLERVAVSVAARADLFDDLVDDEASRWWVSLFRSRAYEVRLLTWELDQTSDWHDHGGSSGAIVVTQGALNERWCGADHVSIESRTLRVGQFGSFGPGHVHDLALAPDRPAVSIHVYSPPLSGLTYYDHTDLGFAAREFIPDADRAPRRTSDAVAPHLLS